MSPLILYSLPDDEAQRIVESCCESEVEIRRAASPTALHAVVEDHSLVIGHATRLSRAIRQQLYQQKPSVQVALIAPDVPTDDLLPLHGVLSLLPATWTDEDLGATLTRWQETTRAPRERKRLTQILTLMDLGQLLTETLEPSELYDQIIHQLDRTFAPNTVSLMMLEEDGEHLQLVAQRGGAVKTGTIVPISEGIAGWVARRAEPQLLLGGLQGTPFEHLARGQGRIGSAMSIPLLMQGRVIGVLNVSRRSDRKLYTEDDADLLSLFAHQIAVALNNAQLYESVRSERDRIMQAQEMVRRELARDLHDGLGQVLATLSVNLGHLHAMLQREAISHQELIEDLSFLGMVARQAVQDARTLTFGLRPLVLETKGLPAALKQYLSILKETHSSTAYSLDVQANYGRDLAPDVARMAFAVLQEAINNARKHAEASQVTVTLGCERQGRRPIALLATVQDNGMGFVLPTDRDRRARISFGLTNMHERAALVGGSITIDSVPGQGTTVRLRIPWRSDKAM